MLCFTIFDVPRYETLFNFSLGRYSSIVHTRLRLNVCCLNYSLILNNLGVYPLRNVCVALKWKELIIIFFIVRLSLLLDWSYSFLCCSYYRWQMDSKAFLFGSSQLSESKNIEFFSTVQLFIKKTGRFTYAEPQYLLCLSRIGKGYINYKRWVLFY